MASRQQQCLNNANAIDTSTAPSTERHPIHTSRRGPAAGAWAAGAGGRRGRRPPGPLAVAERLMPRVPASKSRGHTARPQSQ